MPETPAPKGDGSPQIHFRRAHKSALGLAFGVISGSALFFLTAIHVTLNINGIPLYLLGQYFLGYDVTWPGAFVGLAWGTAVGFIAGWLLGFVHNFTVGLWMFFVVTKQDLKQTKIFLDHI